MGAVHPDHAAHRSSIYKLHATAKENPSSTRDCNIHIYRWGHSRPAEESHSLMAGRNGRWAGYTHYTWDRDTRYCQL